MSKFCTKTNQNLTDEPSYAVKADLKMKL